MLSEINPAFLEAEKRLYELELLLKNADKELSKAPEGNLRISMKGQRALFYRILEKGDTNGKYLRKEEKLLVKNLAQKEYDLKLKAMIQKEAEIIKQFLAFYEQEKDALFNLYEKLNKTRKKLVTPAVFSDEEFAESWKNVDFDHKDFSQAKNELYASNGQRVRSKSELIIAELLLRMDIPFRYEFPVKLGSITVHPDFYLLDKKRRRELIWEHFGRMDNSEYASNAVEKLQLYEKYGWFPGKNFILTMETSGSELNGKMLEKKLREVFLEF